MSVTHVRCGLAAAFLAVALVGCGSSKYQIEGRVVWTDGKPATELAGYTVDFEALEARVSATGIIKTDATFELSTDRPGDGVIAATYKVAINPPIAEGDVPVARSLLPPNYATPDSSGLVETISGKRVVELKVERRKR